MLDHTPTAPYPALEKNVENNLLSSNDALCPPTKTHRALQYYFQLACHISARKIYTYICMEPYTEVGILLSLSRKSGVLSPGHI